MSSARWSNLNKRDNAIRCECNRKFLNCDSTLRVVCLRLVVSVLCFPVWLQVWGDAKTSDKEYLSLVGCYILTFATTGMTDITDTVSWSLTGCDWSTLSYFIGTWSMTPTCHQDCCQRGTQALCLLRQSKACRQCDLARLKRTRSWWRVMDFNISSRIM